MEASPNHTNKKIMNELKPKMVSKTNPKDTGMQTQKLQLDDESVTDNSASNDDNLTKDNSLN